MIGIPPADIDLNQIFLCTVPPEIKKDEKCQCNACRLIRMSEAERAVRIERSGRSRQSRSFTRTTEFVSYANLKNLGRRLKVQIIVFTMAFVQ